MLAAANTEIKMQQKTLLNSSFMDWNGDIKNQICEYVHTMPCFEICILFSKEILEFRTRLETQLGCPYGLTLYGSNHRRI